MHSEIAHDKLWSTHNRTFSADQVEIIRSTSLFRLFHDAFGECRFATGMPPYGDLGRERINWRLVRPGRDVDIGAIHADYWFDAVLPGWADGPSDWVKNQDLDPTLRRGWSDGICRATAIAEDEFAIHVADGTGRIDEALHRSENIARTARDSRNAARNARDFLVQNGSSRRQLRECAQDAGEHGSNARDSARGHRGVPWRYGQILLTTAYAQYRPDETGTVSWVSNWQV